METVVRNSRWTRAPVLDDRGKPHAVRLTDNDIDIFRLLARYRYLSIFDIHAFVGGNPKHLSHRLSLLSREPNLYLKRPQQQRESANANFSPLIYELDTKALTILGELGNEVSRRPPYSFVHELMACQIMASIELGIRQAGNARFIEWPEIFARLPDRLQRTNAPYSLEVRYGEYKHPKAVRADWLPFGIERHGERKTYIFFPGIEADCGTEPIDVSDSERSSINSKFLAYAAIAEQHLYREHWCLPNFFVPIVTTTTVRMQSMIRHLQRLVGRGAIACREADIFLFNTFPSLTSHGAPPHVRGRMFSEAWSRLAKDPFYLGK